MQIAMNSCFMGRKRKKRVGWGGRDLISTLLTPAWLTETPNSLQRLSRRVSFIGFGSTADRSWKTNLASRPDVQSGHPSANESHSQVRGRRADVRLIPFVLRCGAGAEREVGTSHHLVCLFCLAPSHLNHPGTRIFQMTDSIGMWGVEG